MKKHVPQPYSEVSWCGNHTRAGDKRPRLGRREASATPIAFRDVLLQMARSVSPKHLTPNQPLSTTTDVTLQPTHS